MDAQDIISISTESNIAKSCRRIFFNHLYDTNYEKGYHVDVMHGSGSGTLLYYDEKFFLLTAKHVIDKNILGAYQNDSPFWISVNKNPGWGLLYDFLFPKYLYEIGKIISSNTHLIDDDDVSLVELFAPMPLHMPDHFIDLNDKDSYLKRNDYFEGQFLIANGYPFDLNNFNHDFKKDNFTHSTNIVRYSVAGICVIENGAPHISYELTDNGDVNYDGMSGGVVCNARDTPEKVQWAGMSLSSSSGITRFLPAWCIYDAIVSYKQAEKHIIDPAAEPVPDPDKIMDILTAYTNEFVPQ
jgi:hypothetical protein